MTFNVLITNENICYTVLKIFTIPSYITHCLFKINSALIE